MEFAASALTSMATAIGGAGQAAAGAAGTVASAAGSAAGAASSVAGGLSSLLPSGSLVGSILSGGASLLQMSQLRQAGREKALNLELQAQDTRTEMGAETVKLGERKNSLRKALLDTIGERDAAYAASGVDLTFGTPALAREQAVDTAEQTFLQDEATTRFRTTRLNERASNLRAMARSARRSGNDMAMASGIGALGSLLNRG